MYPLQYVECSKLHKILSSFLLSQTFSCSNSWRGYYSVQGWGNWGCSKTLNFAFKYECYLHSTPTFGHVESKSTPHFPMPSTSSAVWKKTIKIVMRLEEWICQDSSLLFSVLTLVEGGCKGLLGLAKRMNLLPLYSLIEQCILSHCITVVPLYWISIFSAKAQILHQSRSVATGWLGYLTIFRIWILRFHF